MRDISFSQLGRSTNIFTNSLAGANGKKSAFAQAVSGQLKNLSQVLQTGARLNDFPDLDQYVDQLGENVDRLSEARLEEFSVDLRKEVTSTLLALREQSVVHVQLKRIASHLRILQNAVARLKGSPCQGSAGPG